MRNTTSLALSTASSTSRPSTSSQGRRRRGFATQRRRKTNVPLRKDLAPEYFVEDVDSFKFEARFDAKAKPIPIAKAPIEDFENDPKFAPPEEAPDKVPNAFRKLPPVLEVEGDAEDTPEALLRKNLLQWTPADESPLVGRTFGAFIRRAPVPSLYARSFCVECKKATSSTSATQCFGCRSVLLVDEPVALSSMVVFEGNVEDTPEAGVDGEGVATEAVQCASQPALVDLFAFLYG